MMMMLKSWEHFPPIAIHFFLIDFSYFLRFRVSRVCLSHPFQRICSNFFFLKPKIFKNSSAALIRSIECRIFIEFASRSLPLLSSARSQNICTRFIELFSSLMRKEGKIAQEYVKKDENKNKFKTFFNEWNIFLRSLENFWIILHKIMKIIHLMVNKASK